MERDNLPFYEFQPVKKEQWENLIKKDLQGQNYKKILKWETLEGFDALPVYTSEDVKSYSPIRQTKTGWTPCYPIYKSDTAKALQKHLAEDSKSTTVWLFPDKERIGRNEIEELIGKLPVSPKAIFIDAENCFTDFVDVLPKSTYRETEIFIKFDPFAHGFKKGNSLHRDKDFLDDIKKSACSGYQSLCADGAFYKNKGASIIQEAGILIATAVEYATILNDTSSVETIWFKTSTGPLYFPELAKYRAIRLMWNRLMEVYDSKTRGNLCLFTETTGYNKARSDAYNNMVRLTNEAMSAVIGGTNYLMIHPYNTTFEPSTPFSDRIAANIHAILREEAHLHEVTDPAAGSYYIERLSNEIAEKGWDFFRKIEKEGGLLKTLQNRTLMSWIHKGAIEREKAYATRKRILVGTNHYSNTDETLPQDRFDNIPGKQKADQTEQIKTRQTKSISEIFDRIRDRTIKAAKKGKEIQALLVPIGDVSHRNTRTIFSQNFLSCAGFKIQQLDGVEHIKDASEKLKNKSADLYVLCGSDEKYLEEAAAFAETINKTGTLILAGNPGKNESLYRSLGFEFFIYAEINMPEVLTAIQNNVLGSEGLV